MWSEMVHKKETFVGVLGFFYNTWNLVRNSMEIVFVLYMEST